MVACDVACGGLFVTGDPRKWQGFLQKKNQTQAPKQGATGAFGFHVFLSLGPTSVDPKSAGENRGAGRTDCHRCLGTVETLGCSLSPERNENLAVGLMTNGNSICFQKEGPHQRVMQLVVWIGDLDWRFEVVSHLPSRTWGPTPQTNNQPPTTGYFIGHLYFRPTSGVHRTCFLTLLLQNVKYCWKRPQFWL